MALGGLTGDDDDNDDDDEEDDFEEEEEESGGGGADLSPALILALTQFLIARLHVLLRGLHRSSFLQRFGCRRLRLGRVFEYRCVGP